MLERIHINQNVILYKMVNKLKLVFFGIFLVLGLQFASAFQIYNSIYSEEGVNAQGISFPRASEGPSSPYYYFVYYLFDEELSSAQELPPTYIIDKYRTILGKISEVETNWNAPSQFVCYVGIGINVNRNALSSAASSGRYQNAVILTSSCPAETLYHQGFGTSDVNIDRVLGRDAKNNIANAINEGFLNRIVGRVHQELVSEISSNLQVRSGTGRNPETVSDERLDEYLADIREFYNYLSVCSAPENSENACLVSEFREASGGEELFDSFRRGGTSLRLNMFVNRAGQNMIRLSSLKQINGLDFTYYLDGYLTNAEEERIGFITNPSGELIEAERPYIEIAPNSATPYRISLGGGSSTCNGRLFAGRNNNGACSIIACSVGGENTAPDISSGSLFSSASGINEMCEVPGRFFGIGEEGTVVSVRDGSGSQMVSSSSSGESRDTSTRIPVRGFSPILESNFEVDDPIFRRIHRMDSRLTDVVLGVRDMLESEINNNFAEPQTGMKINQVSYSCGPNIQSLEGENSCIECYGDLNFCQGTQSDDARIVSYSFYPKNGDRVIESRSEYGFWLYPEPSVIFYQACPTCPVYLIRDYIRDVRGGSCTGIDVDRNNVMTMDDFANGRIRAVYLVATYNQPTNSFNFVEPVGSGSSRSVGQIIYDFLPKTTNDRILRSTDEYLSGREKSLLLVFSAHTENAFDLPYKFYNPDDYNGVYNILMPDLGEYYSRYLPDLLNSEASRRAESARGLSRQTPTTRRTISSCESLLPEAAYIEKPKIDVELACADRTDNDGDRQIFEIGRGMREVLGLSSGMDNSDGACRDYRASSGVSRSGEVRRDVGFTEYDGWIYMPQDFEGGAINPLSGTGRWDFSVDFNKLPQHGIVHIPVAIVKGFGSGARVVAYRLLTIYTTQSRRSISYTEEIDISGRAPGVTGQRSQEATIRRSNFDQLRASLQSGQTGVNPVYTNVLTREFPTYWIDPATSGNMPEHFKLYLMGTQQVANPETGEVETVVKYEHTPDRRPIEVSLSCNPESEHCIRDSCINVIERGYYDLSESRRQCGLRQNLNFVMPNIAIPIVLEVRKKFAPVVLSGRYCELFSETDGTAQSCVFQGLRARDYPLPNYDLFRVAEENPMAPSRRR